MVTNKVKRLTVELVEKALKKSHGNMAVAARSCKVTRTAMMRYIERRPALVELVAQCREEALDEVEDSLYDMAVSRENFQATKYFLACRGRSRGWIEKQDLDIASVLALFGGLGQEANRILAEGVAAQAGQVPAGIDRGSPIPDVGQQQDVPDEPGSAEPPGGDVP